MNRINWSFRNILIAIIICAACIGIMLVALNVFGIPIPPWAVTMFWIVVVATVAIFAIKLLFSMFDGPGPSV